MPIVNFLKFKSEDKTKRIIEPFSIDSVDMGFCIVALLSVKAVCLSYLRAKQNIIER